MPLYDFVVMVKPAVDRRNLVEFMTRVGQRVYARSGVVTNIKSFGRVNLAYDIKKRDGRFSEILCKGGGGVFFVVSGTNQSSKAWKS
ncbi:unnamed protein product [Sphagnum jensenii]